MTWLFIRSSSAYFCYTHRVINNKAVGLNFSSGCVVLQSVNVLLRCRLSSRRRQQMNWKKLLPMKARQHDANNGSGMELCRWRIYKHLNRPLYKRHWYSSRGGHSEWSAAAQTYGITGKANSSIRIINMYSWDNLYQSLPRMAKTCKTI